MIMKLPATNGSGNGYYGHDTSGVITSYLPDASEIHQDDLDSPTPPGDFSEYMWMENEEEFDKQVMQQLEEEALMEQCIEAMLEDEQEIRNIHNQAESLNLGLPNNCNDSAAPVWNGVYGAYELCQEMSSLGLKDELARKVCMGETFSYQNGDCLTGRMCKALIHWSKLNVSHVQSTLNPNAAEFVPGNSTSLTSRAAAKDEHLATSTTTTSTHSDSKDSSQDKATP